MKNNKSHLFGILFVLLLSGVYFSACQRDGHDEHKGHSEHNNQSMSDQKSNMEKMPELWHCPMHPTFTSDGPGECGICGMDLVPVELDESNEMKSEVEGQAIVKISERRQQLIGVKTSRIERKPFKKIVRTIGRIAYDPELYHVQEEYLGALSAYEKIKDSTISESVDRAESLVESSRLRLRLLGLSDRQISKLSQRRGPDTSLLISKGSGVVWMYLDVFEYELPLFKFGQSIEATTISYPGEVFTGTVKSVDPIINPKTRVARVRAEVDNRNGMLKPDMYLNAKIKIDLGERLIVPESAVMDTGPRRIVFVKEGDGIFEPREILLGDKSDVGYHIKSGLYEGETVVTSANFLIDSESKLKASLSALAGSHQH